MCRAIFSIEFHSPVKVFGLINHDVPDYCDFNRHLVCRKYFHGNAFFKNKYIFFFAPLFFGFYCVCATMCVILTRILSRDEAIFGAENNSALTDNRRDKIE